MINISPSNVFKKMLAALSVNGLKILVSLHRIHIALCTTDSVGIIEN